MSDSESTARMMSLESRVLSLESERSIRRLLSSYGSYADSCRDEDWIALWMRDGVLDVELGADSTVYRQRSLWKGHSELRKFISNPDAHRKAGFDGRSLHVYGNDAIVVSGDSAVATTYSLLLQMM